FAIDASSHSAYYVLTAFRPGQMGIGAFSTDSFQSIGPFAFGAHIIESIALCGSLLAVSADYSISFVPVSSLVGISAAAPKAAPLNDDGVLQLQLLTNGIALDRIRGSAYVTTPGLVGPRGNSVWTLD